MVRAATDQPDSVSKNPLLKGDHSHSLLHLWPILTSRTRFLHVCCWHLTFSWQTWIYETRSAAPCCVLWSWSCLRLSVRKSLWPAKVLKLMAKIPSCRYVSLTVVKMRCFEMRNVLRFWFEQFDKTSFWLRANSFIWITEVLKICAIFCGGWQMLLFKPYWL